jgi:hypothetical protein
VNPLEAIDQHCRVVAKQRKKGKVKENKQTRRISEDVQIGKSQEIRPNNESLNRVDGH